MQAFKIYLYERQPLFGVSSAVFNFRLGLFGQLAVYQNVAVFAALRVLGDNPQFSVFKGVVSLHECVSVAKLLVDEFSVVHVCLLSSVRFGLTEAHKIVYVPPGLGGILVNRLAHGRVCEPLGAVVPEWTEYRVARDFVEADDLGEDAEVAYRLVQVKLVCHVVALRLVCFSLAVVTY